MSFRLLLSLILAALVGASSASAEDKLLSVDPEASIIAIVRDSQLKAFWVKASTEITLNGETVPLNKILPGMTATISLADAQTVARIAVKSAAAAPASPHALAVRGQLDGIVMFRLRDGQLSIELGADGHADNLTLNGAPWQPKWKGNVSEPFTAFKPPMEGFKNGNVHLRQLAGRAKMKLEHSAAGFEKTATATVNDNLPSFDIYEFRLDW